VPGQFSVIVPAIGPPDGARFGTVCNVQRRSRGLGLHYSKGREPGVRRRSKRFSGRSGLVSSRFRGEVNRHPEAIAPEGGGAVNRDHSEAVPADSLPVLQIPAQTLRIFLTIALD
jgi:hypothetical protein